MRRDLWESPLPTDKKRSVLNEREKDLVRTGTRTQNLLLRRQAPYPLGHTDIHEVTCHSPALRTCHSSLGVEHSLSKRKVVGSNPACGSQFFLTPCFCWPEARGRARFSGWTARQSYSCVGLLNGAAPPCQYDSSCLGKLVQDEWLV